MITVVSDTGTNRFKRNSEVIEIRFTSKSMSKFD